MKDGLFSGASKTKLRVPRLHFVLFRSIAHIDRNTLCSCCSHAFQCKFRAHQDSNSNIAAIWRRQRQSRFTILGYLFSRYACKCSCRKSKNNKIILTTDIGCVACVPTPCLGLTLLVFGAVAWNCQSWDADASILNCGGENPVSFSIVWPNNVTHNFSLLIIFLCSVSLIHSCQFCYSGICFCISYIKIMLQKY